MAYCRDEGKDKIVFDVPSKTPSKIQLSDEELEEEEMWTKGLVQPDGTLNWECTCRSSMVASRCGLESREFLECAFKHMDDQEEKMVCMDKFEQLGDCMQRNNDYYKIKSDSNFLKNRRNSENEDDNLEDVGKEEEEEDESVDTNKSVKESEKSS